MRSSKAALREAGAPLVQLLEQSFLDGGDADAALAAEVSASLWGRALLDPLRDFLARPSKEFRARLVSFGYRLGGGTPDGYPCELPLVIETLHAGSLIVDDIEDGSASRRGGATLHRRYGLPVALNAGNWLYFWAQAQLSRLPLSDTMRLVAHERIAACLMRCHEGQALDLTVRVDELAQAQVPPVVHAITRLKTGSLLGLATFLGALTAGASGERLAAIAAFGRSVGVGLQMLDDLSGIVHHDRRHKAMEDLRLGRATWVWAWLATHLPAEGYQQLRLALRDVREGAPGDALVERMRFRLGAVGLQGARAQLQGAAGAICAAIGDGAWYDDLLGELAWLERGYVDG
jgi:geranylgeranyl pyrophosphate synthase